MTRGVKWRISATDDLREQFHWNAEEQCDPRRASRFLTDVEATLADLCVGDHAEIAPLVEDPAVDLPLLRVGRFLRFKRHRVLYCTAPGVLIVHRIFTSDRAFLQVLDGR